MVPFGQVTERPLFRAILPHMSLLPAGLRLVSARSDPEQGRSAFGAAKVA